MVAATVHEVYGVPNLIVVSKRQVRLTSTRSRHPSVGMETARWVGDSQSLRFNVRLRTPMASRTVAAEPRIARLLMLTVCASAGLEVLSVHFLPDGVEAFRKRFCVVSLRAHQPGQRLRISSLEPSSWSKHRKTQMDADKGTAHGHELTRMNWLCFALRSLFCYA